jgi:hypothetical protein
MGLKKEDISGTSLNFQIEDLYMYSFLSFIGGQHVDEKREGKGKYFYSNGKGIMFFFHQEVFILENVKKEN